ncbi:hypothetical protein GJ496_003448 [Pomphorhynchus laevis]|nr:hypothetical protein GJ496_003448 [Pomphorhynchus laevis]
MADINIRVMSLSNSDLDLEGYIMFPSQFSAVYFGEHITLCVVLEYSTISISLSSVLQLIANIKCDNLMKTTYNLVPYQMQEFSSNDVSSSFPYNRKTKVYIFKFQIKDLATHTLTCNAVQYLKDDVALNLPSSVSSSHSTNVQPISSRSVQKTKQFQFEVNKPFNCTHSCITFNETGKCLIYAILQNLTLFGCEMNKVVFEPSLTGIELNLKNSKSLIDSQKESRMLQPNQCCQYVFSFDMDMNVLKNNRISDLGRLLPVNIKLFEHPISVEIREIPVGQVAKCQEITILVTNCSLLTLNPRTVDLQVSFANSNNALFWSGLSNAKVGILQAGENVKLKMELIPLRTGLHSLGRLSFLDVISNDLYTFSDLGYVMIC